MTASLTLAPGLLEKIIEHALAGYPQETCGLLAGNANHATRFIPMENRLASRTSYEMDPAELIQTLREFRDAGEQLVAICHSHPSTPAEPSHRDIERAYYPDAAYLIVSLAERRPEVRAFRISAGEAVEIEVHAIV
jgi:proteasome lid subunit RPN8/RPN11